tara:strand:- start:418 stop:555 length:138 start_codon:yes stop_codon:yes gene_type:complete
MEKEVNLMDDPATIGALIQILLIMNPNQTFYVTRQGENVIVKDKD